MHSLFAGFLPKHHFAPAPTASFDAEEDAVQADLDALRAVLEAHHHEIAALLMEPLLQAAGGLNMTSPAYLRGARRLCDEFDVLLILDESPPASAARDACSPPSTPISRRTSWYFPKG